jgi:hypothetical protein
MMGKLEPESPMNLMVKTMGFRLRFSLKPIQWTDLHVLQRRLNLPTYCSAAVSQHVKRTPYCKKLAWPLRTFIPPFAQHHWNRFFAEFSGQGNVWNGWCRNQDETFHRFHRTTIHPSDYHPELVGLFQFADGFHMLKVKSVIIITLYNSYIFHLQMPKYP